MATNRRSGPLTLCLPTADRAVAHAIHLALGFAPEGEPDERGIPEPLQFVLGDGLRLVLIPPKASGGSRRVDRPPIRARPSA